MLPNLRAQAILGRRGVVRQFIVRDKSILKWFTFTAQCRRGTEGGEA